MCPCIMMLLLMCLFSAYFLTTGCIKSKHVQMGLHKNNEAGDFPCSMQACLESSFTDSPITFLLLFKLHLFPVTNLISDLLSLASEALVAFSSARWVLKALLSSNFFSINSSGYTQATVKLVLLTLHHLAEQNREG